MEAERSDGAQAIGRPRRVVAAVNAENLQDVGESEEEREQLAVECNRNRAAHANRARPSPVSKEGEPSLARASSCAKVLTLIMLCCFDPQFAKRTQSHAHCSMRNASPVCVSPWTRFFGKDTISSTPSSKESTVHSRSG